MTITGLSLTDDNVAKMLNATSEVANKTCHQLFKNTPIKYFGYYKFYDAGLLASYVTDPDLTAVILREDLMPTYVDIETFQKYGIRSVFLSHNLPLPAIEGDVDFDKYKKVISHAADFGSYNALLIVDRFLDYFRYCIFAVNVSHKSVLNFYLNSFSHLDRFIKYFEDNTRDLFAEDECNSARIILPQYYNRKQNDAISAELYLSQHGFDFLSEQPQSLSHKGSLITNREMDCLSLIAQGYTMKNAAKKLCISHRTVEQHLRNIKDKFGLNTKNQLVEIWHEFNQNQFS